MDFLYVNPRYTLNRFLYTSTSSSDIILVSSNITHTRELAASPISQAMVGNPQTYPPPDPQLLANFASIGIGPGKTPSKEAATNSTLNAALQTGITEGQKLITKGSKRWNKREWLASTGTYGINYLLRM